MRVFRNQTARMGVNRYHFDIQVNGHEATIFNVWYFNDIGMKEQPDKETIAMLYDFI